MKGSETSLLPWPTLTLLLVVVLMLLLLMLGITVLRALLSCCMLSTEVKDAEAKPRLPVLPSDKASLFRPRPSPLLIVSSIFDASPGEGAKTLLLSSDTRLTASVTSSSGPRPHSLPPAVLSCGLPSPWPSSSMSRLRHSISSSCPRPSSEFSEQVVAPLEELSRRWTRTEGMSAAAVGCVLSLRPSSWTVIFSPDTGEMGGVVWVLHEEEGEEEGDGMDAEEEGSCCRPPRAEDESREDASLFTTCPFNG